jgi:hypothetical protein
MTSISAWNDMMEQFLAELLQTFPEEKAIKKYYTSFDLLRKSNARKCIDGYMSEVGKVQDKIMAKDESFFLSNDSTGILSELNLKQHWTPELSPNTKDAIWQYLQTLYILGTTITMVPPETLNMIESIASDCASKMQGDGGGGGFDPSALSGLFSSLGGMLGDTSSEKKLT